MINKTQLMTVKIIIVTSDNIQICIIIWNVFMLNFIFNLIIIRCSGIFNIGMKVKFSV
jgi:hypothetical protein